MDQPLADLARPSLKKLKPISFLGRKQKKVTKKSERENVLDKLVKKRIAQGQMKNELQALGLQGTESEVRYYESLYNSKVDIRSWGFAKNLIARPLKLYVYGEMTDKIMTSDFLYWSYRGFNALGDNFLKPYVKLQRIQVCSRNAMIYNVKENVAEFYYEDLNKDVFCPSYNQEFDYQFPENADTFTLFDKQYRAATNVNEAVPIYIAPVDMTADQARVVITNAKKMKDKKNLSAGFKELSKTEGSYYFQHLITATNFCPNVMSLKPGRDNAQWNFKMLFEFELVPDMLLNYFKNNWNNISDFIAKIITWDNLDSLHEFVGAAIITIKNNDERFAQINMALDRYYKYYSENKKVIDLYKKLFVMFRKLVLAFLDSFTSRIGIDRMEKIRMYATEYIDGYNLLARNQADNNIINTFVGFFVNDKLSNFLSSDSVLHAKTIKEVCEQILNPSTGDEAMLEMNVRALGLKLMTFLYGGDNQMFNEIRAPNAFLGNTVGTSSVAVLREIIENLMSKVMVREGNQQLEMEYAREIANEAKNQMLAEIRQNLGNNQNLNERVLRQIEENYRPDQAIINDISKRLLRRRIEDRRERIRNQQRDAYLRPRGNENIENARNELRGGGGGQAEQAGEGNQPQVNNQQQGRRGNPPPNNENIPPNQQ